MELSGLKEPVRIELSCHVHATEDEKKVLKALWNVLPEHMRESGRVSVTSFKVRGYYGNPILIITASVSGPDAKEVLEHLFEKLSSEDRKYLSETLTARFQGGKLYLRLNKQKAYAGVIGLSEGDDVIRVVVSFKRK